MWRSAGAGNAKAAQLSEQLEKEKAEARQRTADAERLSAQLSEKERLLNEASELMKEAERQHAAQQAKQDSLAAEMGTAERLLIEADARLKEAERQHTAQLEKQDSLAAEVEALRTASAEQSHEHNLELERMRRINERQVQDGVAWIARNAGDGGDVDGDDPAALECDERHALHHERHSPSLLSLFGVCCGAQRGTRRMFC